MKVRTCLFLLSAIFVILISALGYVMFYASNQVAREVKGSESATQIIKDISELNIVTYEYLTHHEERMVQQWVEKYDSLGELLEGLRMEKTHPEYLSIVEAITSDYESLGNFFSQIQTNYSDRARLTEENKPQAQIEFSLISEERLTAQALIRSQRMTSESFRLSSLTQQNISQVQQRTNSIALISIIGFVVLSFCISFLTTRSIIGPLNELIKSSEVIGSGNLKHRVFIKTRNEIGRLAKAFNEMAANLQQSLGETAYSRRLLLVLSQVAQSVQRAHTPEDIYRTVGDQVAKLGYHAMVLTLSEDRKHLSTPYLTFEPSLLHAVEKLTGLSTQGYRFEIVPGGFFERIIAEDRTTFTGRAVDSLAESLPDPMRPLAGRLTKILGIEESIYAPLRVGNEIYGLLSVNGVGLTEADVPAVTTFANQTAIALENAQLYEDVHNQAVKLEDRVSELSALNAIIAATTATLDLKELLDITLDHTLSTLGLKMGAIWVTGRSAVRGFSEELSQALGQSSRAASLDIPASIIVEDWQQTAADQPHSILGPVMARSGIRSSITIPILIKGQRIGGLSIASPVVHPWSAEEMSLVEAVGQQIAIGVEKARLYEQVQRDAAELEQRVEERTTELVASEIRYKSLFESVPLGVGIISLEGRFLSHNDAMCQMTGYSGEELTRIDLKDVYQNPEDRERLLQRLRSEGPVHGFETRLRRKDGTLFDVNLTITSVTVGDEHVLLMVAEDITERKRLGKEVNRVYDLSIDMIGVASLDGYFTRLNPTWEKALGYTQEELISQPYLDFVHPDDRDATIAEAQKLATGEVTIEFENRYRCKDGSYKWLSWNTTPDVTEELLYFVARDITERKRAQDQIRKYSHELEAAYKELEAFSYSVSHDLRAPLRAMDGFSRILLEEHAPSLSEEIQRYLQVIRDNAQRMGDLIEDLLAFSRLSRQPLKKQRVEPTHIIRQVLEDLRAEQEGREIEITIDDLPACQADPTLLKQVFINLLGNSLKFTRERQRAVIEVGCQTDNVRPGENVYFVKDNGVGFDMQYADKLFGVFQRLHRPEEYEGTGVGLANVQRIVHRHGGRVWAEAAVDKGATFYFTLEGGTTNG
jgi:PAS domain S-box-containing protein